MALTEELRGTGYYIYGVIRGSMSHELPVSGIEGNSVYTVPRRELVAVVSDVEPREIDPTRANMRAHTEVQERLLSDHDLLPAKFGTIAENEGEVVRFLEESYEKLDQGLARVAGKIEVAVKAFWNREAMMAQLQREDRKLARIKAKLDQTTSPEEAHQLKFEAGQQVERVARDWQARYAQRIYERLAKLSADARREELTDVKNLLNAAFLVERLRETEIRSVLHELDAHYEGKLDFQYVGFLPPYSFVELEL